MPVCVLGDPNQLQRVLDI